MTEPLVQSTLPRTEVDHGARGCHTYCMTPSWTLEGIQCLFSEPERTRLHWAFEACKLILESQTHAANMRNALQQNATMKLTRARLKNMCDLLEAQVATYQRILRPLGWQHVDQNALVNFLNMNPGSSILAQNVDNVFRDWCWGEAENDVALELIASVLEDQKPAGEMLVLGGGAGRLAYDLHRRYSLTQTSVLDFNPLLTFVAQKLIAGETLDWVEFPMVPTHAGDFAIKRQLCAPSAQPEGIGFILADLTQDALELPKVDVVVTPWLIDVVKMDLKNLLQRINSYLPEKGLWLNFGPLGFNSPILADYYSYEEVVHLVERSGFKILSSRYEKIPYMQSPASNSHRMEQVFCFRAQKVSDVEVEPIAREGLLPWEVDADEPIQIPVVQMRLEKAFLLNSKVCDLLSGEPSFNQLIDGLLKDYPVPREQLGYMLQHILRNLYAQALVNPLSHS